MKFLSTLKWMLRTAFFLVVGMLLIRTLVEYFPALQAAPLFRAAVRSWDPMLSDIVANLDQLDDLIPTVAALGRRHRDYGVRDADYDRVREALLGAIGSALGDAFTREVRSAWEEAYALMASVMKRAV